MELDKEEVRILKREQMEEKQKKKAQTMELMRKEEDLILR